MTREETASFIRAYLDGDTAIGNIIPIRDVLESAITYLKEQPSLPEGLDEAALAAVPKPNGIESNTDFSFFQMVGMFEQGVKWLMEQGVTMQITDDTQWEEVDRFVHRNCDGASVIQIRKKEN